MTLESYAMMALVFVCAGLAYSLAGYKAKVSKYLRGDAEVHFSINRISKKIGLGIFLGIVAFASEELLNGDDVIIDITDPGVFAKQVMLTMGIIYSVDKMIIAGSDGGTRRTPVKDAPPPPPLDPRLEFDNDVPPVADDGIKKEGVQ